MSSPRLSRSRHATLFSRRRHVFSARHQAFVDRRIIAMMIIDCSAADVDIMKTSSIRTGASSMVGYARRRWALTAPWRPAENRVAARRRAAISPMQALGRWPLFRRARQGLSQAAAACDDDENARALIVAAMMVSLDIMLIIVCVSTAMSAASTAGFEQVICSP